ncbi:MAG: hypothetical protein R2825_02840 [Saprospiraceae bacterium]
MSVFDRLQFTCRDQSSINWKVSIGIDGQFMIEDVFGKSPDKLK